MKVYYESDKLSFRGEDEFGNEVCVSFESMKYKNFPTRKVHLWIWTKDDFREYSIPDETYELFNTVFHKDSYCAKVRELDLFITRDKVKTTINKTTYVWSIVKNNANFV